MTTGALRTYDPSRVIVKFHTVTVTGFAEGTDIAASRTQDLWEMVMGRDGEATRVKQTNKSGTVTFSLKMAVPSNTALQALVDLDEQLNLGVGPLLIKDYSGTALVAAATSFIKRIPDWARNTNDESVVEWMIVAPILKIKHGENQAATS